MQYLHTQGSYDLFENHPDKEWIILNMFSNANIDVTSIQSSEIINKIVNQDISFNLTTTVEHQERTPFLYKGAIIDDIRRAEAKIDLEETLDFLVNELGDSTPGNYSDISNAIDSVRNQIETYNATVKVMKF